MVTGGAGFIGRHVTSRLLAAGHDVIVYDALIDQVHQGRPPEAVFDDPRVTFVRAQITDRDALGAALLEVDQVVHLAAEVGVGQSMYLVDRYVQANTGGTGLLLDLIVNTPAVEISKIVVASSMSIYGEGLYRCREHGLVAPDLRSAADLQARRWELSCPECGQDLLPVPTTETKELKPSSVYAITKMDQELLCLAVGGAYGIDTTAVRYFNAYGPGQSLSNPYTGVAAIFISRLLNGQRPLVNEDGRQIRDFVHVEDVAAGTVAALSAQGCAGQVFNLGSGQPISIYDLAVQLAAAVGRSDLTPQVLDQFRVGDIRHCWADISRSRALLGYQPQHNLRRGGMDRLIEWARTQTAVDNVDAAAKELHDRGLVR
ncbi:NAD-dependent epimerase/dehydratase family protein [Mycolicibacterium fortuitum]|uniref:NAD-dependent epimerase/dehydratase family protein n=1 Tax=Mycolicibacterium fortuitum TaxID=1766 RepID=UPI00262C206A|nr:NAD-dependent epimerase/dehydratase family protein [Mycolicibacterium fortuitum]